MPLSSSSWYLTAFSAHSPEYPSARFIFSVSPSALAWRYTLMGVPDRRIFVLAPTRPSIIWVFMPLLLS